MRRTFFLALMLALSIVAFAGFKAKTIKPKKPEQFQAMTTVGGVIYAADLLLDGKAQKEFFYKELTSSNLITVRLAVFNTSRGGVVLPMEGIQLLGPSGKELAMVAPGVAAEAVLEGAVVSAEAKNKGKPVSMAPNTRTGDPRYDRTDPRYDPRMDPNDPTYDPTDPRNRRAADPRYNDPRYNDPRYGGSGYPRPGVDVVLNPRAGGGGGGSAEGVSDIEKQLVEKDFNDKAHSSDPIDGSMMRDRFLFFSMMDRPLTDKGFELHIPPGKGIPQEIVLRF